jgi:hypothetical protein
MHVNYKSFEKKVIFTVLFVLQVISHGNKILKTAVLRSKHMDLQVPGGTPVKKFHFPRFLLYSFSALVLRIHTPYLLNVFMTMINSYGTFLYLIRVFLKFSVPFRVRKYPKGKRNVPEVTASCVLNYKVAQQKPRKICSIEQLSFVQEASKSDNFSCGRRHIVAVYNRTGHVYEI